MPVKNLQTSTSISLWFSVQFRVFIHTKSDRHSDCRHWSKVKTAFVLKLKYRFIVNLSEAVIFCWKKSKFNEASRVHWFKSDNFTLLKNTENNLLEAGNFLKLSNHNKNPDKVSTHFEPKWKICHDFCFWYRISGKWSSVLNLCSGRLPLVRKNH